MKVYAYAFEKIGFDVPEGEIEVRGDVSLEFIAYDEGTRLDAADGLIVPEGVFETWDNGRMLCDGTRLLAREREVSNLLETRKRLCFLVQHITDRFQPGPMSDSIDIRDTDLCKRVLNIFEIRRSTLPRGSTVRARDDAFRPYVANYGVSQTLFSMRSPVRERTRALATVALGVNVAWQFHETVPHPVQLR